MGKEYLILLVIFLLALLLLNFALYYDVLNFNKAHPNAQIGNNSSINALTIVMWITVVVFVLFLIWPNPILAVVFGILLFVILIWSLVVQAQIYSQNSWRYNNLIAALWIVNLVAILYAIYLVFFRRNRMSWMWGKNRADCGEERVYVEKEEVDIVQLKEQW
jgi:hypothetical protein